MRRVFLFLILVAAAAALWFYRDDATRIATEKLPALAAYLPAAPGRTGTAASAATPRAAPPAVPVVLASVEKRPLPVTIEAVGTVQAIASIQIKARIDSQIASISVQEGARVKEGDLLLTLDNRALTAQLAQADALVMKDKAQLEQTRRDLARAEDLLAKRINSEVQRDTAATAVKVQQAQLAADEAQRANLAASLSYTEIRAPISGRIGSIALKLGTTVKAADTLSITTVNQIDPIYVSFAVPQTLFGDLRQALSQGRVKVEARVGGSVTTGEITFVENTVDLATGTVLAKATMPNADERLWPGAFVAVRAVLSVQADALAVPSSAVQIGQQGSYVFVVKNGRTAEIRPVKVDRTIGPDSVISTGLANGEQVVVDGQLRLVGGATVQIQKASDGVAKGEPPGATPPRRS